MKLSPVYFQNFKKSQNNYCVATRIISFRAKGDTFEKTSKPSAQEAQSALQVLSSFFNIDLKNFSLDNLGILPKINPNLDKYTTDFCGIRLLNSNNLANKNETKYQKAIEHIRNIGYEKLATKPEIKAIKAKKPTLWSLTSEFDPIKVGGLGAVPPEITKNAKKLGVNIPTFIPMYNEPGISNLTKVGDDYTYTYKGEKLGLEKAAKFDMDIYQNGEIKTVPVEIFINDNKERQLVFIKCDNYFDGSIYEANTKVQEPEKFVIFTKAIYELAKLKTDKNYSPKNLEILSSFALENIKEPHGMILNDWHASPFAALARYRAPMENACGILSDEASNKLKDMNIITIGHNALYQGLIYDNNDIQRRNNNTNILNTLFDKFAYDIVSNATIKSEKLNSNTIAAKMDIDNVLMLKAYKRGNNYVDLLNMGIILSDYFCPVSKNYAKELVKKKNHELSYDIQDALIQKEKAGRLIGVMNGNDFDSISIEARKEKIKKQTGLEFETYTRESTPEEISEAKLKNKINLYNNFILPFSNSSASSKDDIKKVKNLTKGLEFVKSKNQTHLPILSNEELVNTPILTSGGRLVSQKGIDILCDSLKTLFDNWEKDFPNKNKPIVYIAGADGEGGKQREYIEKFKESLGEDSNRIVFMHGFAPMPALMAGSDFFLMPSVFEPCGLTQSESLALATPAIASAVGGLADTINRNGKQNGILTTKRKSPDKEEFYQAMKKGLTIYFDNKKEYSKMVQDSISENFSWIQPNKTGPIYEYMNLIGIKR